jgi:hypothetical protein
MGGGLAWGGFGIGLVIVALAVGIPYFLTHRRMRDPHDVSDSRAYLRARPTWVRRWRISAASQPGTAGPDTRADHNAIGFRAARADQGSGNSRGERR